MSPFSTRNGASSSSPSAFLMAPAVPSGSRVDHVAQPHAELRAVAEVVLQRVRPVAAREHDVLDAVAAQQVDLVGDERPVHQRHHRLRAACR